MFTLRVHFRVLLLSILATSCTCFAAGHNKASQALHELFRAEWDYAMEQSPTRASQLGDRRWNHLWPDVSPMAMQKRHEHQVARLSRLTKIDRRKLPAPDQLNYDLFVKETQLSVEEYGFGWHLIPLDQREGIQLADELGDALRFESAKDYEDWIARMRGFGNYLDQTMALMSEGMRLGMVLPKVTMQRVPGQIEKQIVTEATSSPFYKPLQRFPAGVPEGDRARLERDAKTAIESVVVPAYRRFHEFFTKSYLPKCYDEVGASHMPHGEAMYAFFARKYTTTPMTPKEIHETGLREVARIRAAMENVKAKAGFQGTLGEFFQHLRTDPQFYYKSGEALLSAYGAMSKRIDPTLVKLFRTMPRMPFGIEPIPAKVAPDTTTAYYRQPAADGSRAGTYFVNLYRPEVRPTYEMMALSLHEAVPGHHFQIALAMEQTDLPNFRRHGSITAYVEGWGLYAEHLGEELGLYDDPYSKFGQLTYEMWRAVRLVVDTGMHQFGWTRQRAILYFKDNAAKSEQDIVNEIDRYISWPGQALAYKIGELKIKELRARAERELGAQFDVRAFHDAVLLSGAVPLDILDSRVTAWIQQSKLAKSN